MIKRILIFLVLNFGALWLGSMFTTSGVTSDWYQNLLKAPWTPPGWVFGASWTFIMLCFTVYLAILYPKVENAKKLIFLFGVQWILNISWNPVFFYFHQVVAGLFIIAFLTVLVYYFLFNYKKYLGSKSLLILPYGIWLLIATSLNAYIYLFNF